MQPATISPDLDAVAEANLLALLGQGASTIARDSAADAIADSSDTYRTIHGVRLRRLTLADLILLLGTGNAFFATRAVGPGEVLRSAVEVLFTGSRRTAKEAVKLAKQADYGDLLDEFAATLPSVNVEGVMAEVRNYVAENSETRVDVDAPPGPQTQTPGNG